MYDMSLHMSAWVRAVMVSVREAIRAGGRRLGSQSGQTTAEYALVILAAAAIALVLIAWAQSSGKLPAFFDKVIDDLINSF
jgi:Flp pilus assembly pilin Flp